MSEAEEKVLEPAKIVSPKEREKMVPLDWPVEWDGKVWSEVRLRRVTGGEMAAYLDAVMTRTDSDPMPMIPVIDCPIQVYDAMDDDDRFRVDTEARPFTPRRLEAMVELTQEISKKSSAK